jgi:hypothetical protein
MEHGRGDDAAYERVIKLGLPCVYYKLNDKQGEVQVRDHSGYAFHATAVGGVASIPGIAGDAATFAGTAPQPIFSDNPSNPTAVGAPTSTTAARGDLHPMCFYLFCF